MRASYHSAYAGIQCVRPIRMLATNANLHDDLSGKTSFDGHIGDPNHELWSPFENTGKCKHLSSVDIRSVLNLTLFDEKGFG